uniref:Uncharacterized protein n=1 Tax=Tetranychus urticae TaxID=32264 RepID=T1JSJ0_TETUR
MLELVSFFGLKEYKRADIIQLMLPWLIVIID